MNPSVSQYEFKVNKEAAADYTRSVALAAMIIAPGYLFFIEGVANLYALLVFTLFAGSLPYLLRWLRGLAGGVERITITEDTIELDRKKSSESLRWVDVASVTFEHVNETPWIMIKTNDEETQRILLEDFDKNDQQHIFELIVGEVPEKTREKSTWIIGNRIPMTIYDRDVVAPAEIQADKPEKEDETKKRPIGDLIMLALLLASGIYYTSQAVFSVSTLVANNAFTEGSSAYESGNFDQAFALFQKAGEVGDDRAYALLGDMYRHGQGVEQDYAKAAEWYYKAAEQGIADAQFQLGYMYRKGRGVEQSDAEALKWYQKSADQGSDKGQNGLAYMYQKGLAVKQDYARAVELYRAAADSNHAGAQLNLGFMYFKGMGMNKDLIQSYKWWSLSAANGNKKAKKNVGIISNKMSEAQLAEAEKLVSNWRATH